MRQHKGWEMGFRNRFRDLPRGAALLAAFAMLPGCASIVSGRTQEVTINTNPQGAHCRLTRENALIAVVPRTPGTVRIDRAKAPIQVSCQKSGHNDTAHLVDSEIEQMVFGNIAIGGLLGWGIDSATGADNRYDSTVNITLLPAPGGDPAMAPMADSSAAPKLTPAAPPLRQVAQVGDVSQASWAAQRAANYTSQSNTAPVDYMPPSEGKGDSKKDEAKAEDSKATGLPMVIKPGASAKPTTAARPATAPAAATAAAAPMAPAPAPGLPAGYKPSIAAPSASAEKAPVAAMADKPASPSSAGPWRAHLASHRTEGAAINEWQELLKRDPKLYGQFDPSIAWVDVKDRGSFARLMIGGWADRKEADAACAKIRGPQRYCAAVKE